MLVNDVNGKLFSVCCLVTRNERSYDGNQPGPWYQQFMSGIACNAM